MTRGPIATTAGRARTGDLPDRASGGVRRRRWGSPSAPTPGPIIGDRNAEVIVVGDIGWCGSNGPAATAQLVDRLSGTLLLAGDIAYPNGSAADFQNCFHPTWGRFRDRWYAVPGNHDYLTPNAEGYFNYFGHAAGADRTGYYTILVGDWQVLMLNSNVPAQRNTPQWEFVRRETGSAAPPVHAGGVAPSALHLRPERPESLDARPVQPARGRRRRRRRQRPRSRLRAVREADRRGPARRSRDSPVRRRHRRRRPLPLHHGRSEFGRSASRSSACCACSCSRRPTAGSSPACRAAWPTRAASPATDPAVHLS